MCGAEKIGTRLKCLNVEQPKIQQRVNDQRSKLKESKFQDQRSKVQINYQTPHAAETAQQRMITDVARESNSIMCATSRL
jgi:hypothetical protein